MKLTAFEEYMLLDSHPAYPMSCFLGLTFKGNFDFGTFTAAANAAVLLHPLLSSTAEKIPSGSFRWQHHPTPVTISEKPFDPDRCFPAATGIDLFKEPPLKITVCRESEQTTHVSVEIHHSACDAAGCSRFVEDLFVEYAKRNGMTVTSERESVKTELLPNRGKYGLTLATWLRIFPRQLWGLTRAWMFLFNRVEPLVAVPVLLDSSTPPDSFPAVLVKTFSKEETLQIRRQAKTAGETLNDVAIIAVFESLATCNSQLATSGYFRIAVPTNLRTDEDRLMSAANIVSMVFIDRKPNRVADTASFRNGICGEMLHIKRCRLGLALIHGLRIYRHVFGSFTKMIRRDKCWTTATVSNLGVMFSEVPLLRRDGKICFGNGLELAEVISVPPIRPQTVFGICVLTYAEKLSVNVHYDSSVVTQSDAEKFLDETVKCFDNHLTYHS
ncbi:hypothetical protein FACS1894170_10280 [Planctomycetales bacterium]|nr:hypothetical protein FACS1894170_10280 [Planctomycetales bacterium]